ncbi:hypothetical protein KVT40_008642 [Elsinoe batatas]|uniref:S-adenosyl-L-methionine-dependent methyltransferase n=1 Tax=Elsinoe batatas TaxID=2601811 RepID=A0A8K0KTJ9_9PEZI|nr:hypothetical protein KVT40_008642 [Elsinoe batatas]
MAFDQLRLLLPFYFLALSLAFLPKAVGKLIITFQFGKLLSWSSLQDAWFGTLWEYLGPNVKQNAAPKVEPLVRQAKGVVLDIGPGSGQWLDLYSPKQNQNITKIYGIEPNLEHHPALLQAIKREGLDDIYEVIGAGVEDLQKVGLQPGSFDTVVTVQVLCSVPDPQRVVTELYKLLKPGGQWIVYEHIKTLYTYKIIATWQKIIDIAWPICYGGCSITRPTDEYLARAGTWTSFDLRPNDDETKYDAVPHAKGVLIK